MTWFHIRRFIILVSFISASLILFYFLGKVDSVIQFIGSFEFIWIILWAPLPAFLLAWLIVLPFGLMQEILVKIGFMDKFNIIELYFPIALGILFVSLTLVFWMLGIKVHFF